MQSRSCLSLRLLHTLQACALGCLLAPAAHAASFDCAKKSSQVETVICADAKLSKQDEALAATYGAALKQREGAQRDSLRREERQWLAHRNAACALPDVDNEANRIAAARCVGSETARRIEALKTGAGSTPAPAPPQKKAADQYRRGAGDTLDLSAQPDGSASLAIMAGNVRGVCDVELDGKRASAGHFFFKDPDSDCAVSVEVKGKKASVDSSGSCNSFCGAHAPDFTGDYLRR
ncbi:MAG: hypothetical protein JWN73_4482 [Betaproteobacteria bacterium]|nr:hypothetical protein [Betaproteobacteria bacterium]